MFGMKRFSLFRLLALVSLLSLMLAILTPSFLKSREVQKIRRFVLEELDHRLIRDSARQLLSKQDTREQGITIVDENKLPSAIIQTNPRQVRIRKQVMTIQYGGGISLVIVPMGQVVPRGEPLKEGIAYFESSITREE